MTLLLLLLRDHAIEARKFVREFLRQITDSYSGKMFRESPGADTQQSEISQPGEIEERRVQIYGKIGPDIP